MQGRRMRYLAGHIVMTLQSLRSMADEFILNRWELVRVLHTLAHWLGLNRKQRFNFIELTEIKVELHEINVQTKNIKL